MPRTSCETSGVISLSSSSYLASFHSVTFRSSAVLADKVSRELRSRRIDRVLTCASSNPCRTRNGTLYWCEGNVDICAAREYSAMATCRGRLTPVVLHHIWFCAHGMAHMRDWSSRARVARSPILSFSLSVPASVVVEPPQKTSSGSL